jgi:hypothetical protein
MDHMEHIYKEMLKCFLRKRYKQIEKDLSTEVGGLKDLGKMELIEDLFDYFGFGDINDETLTPDQVMIKLYKRDH